MELSKRGLMTTGRKMECWRSMLDVALKDNNESWSDIEYNTMNDADMDREFDAGYREGCAFIVLTKNYVYFPVQCEISSGLTELVESVPRNPNGVATKHI